METARDSGWVILAEPPWVTFPHLRLRSSTGAAQAVQSTPWGCSFEEVDVAVSVGQNSNLGCEILCPIVTTDPALS